jgi:hypothetical protein
MKSNSWVSNSLSLSLSLSLRVSAAARDSLTVLFGITFIDKDGFIKRGPKDWIPFSSYLNTDTGLNCEAP